MKRLTLISLLLITLVFSFCKKKKEEPAPEPEPTPAPTPPPPTDGDMGAFTAVYNVTDMNAIGFGMVKDSSVIASFYSDSGPTKTNVSCGSVDVNGVPLSQNSSPIIYSKTNVIDMQSLTWNVTGSGTIAAMNFVHVPVYPKYNGSASLPDTVSKAAGFSVVINSVTPMTGTIGLSIFQVGTTVSKTYSTALVVENIPASDISTYQTGNSFCIKLTFTNFSTKTLNTFKYRVNDQCVYIKYVYLKP